MLIRTILVVALLISFAGASYAADPVIGALPCDNGAAMTVSGLLPDSAGNFRLGFSFNNCEIGGNFLSDLASPGVQLSQGNINFATGAITFNTNFRLYVTDKDGNLAAFNCDQFVAPGSQYNFTTGILSGPPLQDNVSLSCNIHGSLKVGILNLFIKLLTF